MNDDLTRLSLPKLMLRAEAQLDRSEIPGETLGALMEAHRIRDELHHRRDTGTVRADIEAC
jgi:hypothetical protein